MAKTVIRKGIVRKIKTADFEQLDVHVEIEEEISWTTDNEREKETKKVSDKLLGDFVDTYNKVVETIGVERCIGVVNTNMKKDNASKKDDFEFDLE